jgi:hypothetical protein
MDKPNPRRRGKWKKGERGNYGNPLWKPGVSGNPSGRKAIPEDVRALAKTYTLDAINALARALKHRDARVQITAAALLLDRGWGKCPQPLAGDPNSPPIPIKGIIEFVNRTQPGETIELTPTSIAVDEPKRLN